MFWAGDAPAGDIASPLTWINYGVLGLLVLAFFTRRIAASGELEEKKADLIRLREEYLAEVARVRAENTAEMARLRVEHSEALRQMREERDRALAKVDAMADTYKTELVPSLNKFLTTIEILLPLLQRQAGGEQP